MNKLKTDYLCDLKLQFMYFLTIIHPFMPKKDFAKNCSMSF